MENILTKKIVLFLGALVMLSAGCSDKKIDYFGVKNGVLTPCPSRPNCVSSQSDDPDNYAAPLTYTDSQTASYEKLKKILQNIKRITIVTEKENYIHVEFRSAVFHFVDDVEFYFDDSKKTIHLRSASRTGYYDFGANRKRIELIRTMFNRK